MERDPTRKVGLLDTSEWATYTEEEPNALAVEEIPRFMDSAREIHPQHYAMLALGLVTGRRPSELRPLRRTGREPDILWQEGVLLKRRLDTLDGGFDRRDGSPGELSRYVPGRR